MALEMEGPLERHPHNEDFYRYRGAWMHWAVIMASRKRPYAVLSEAEAAALYWRQFMVQEGERGFRWLKAFKQAAGPHLPE
jgi:hypothetical protein